MGTNYSTKRMDFLRGNNFQEFLLRRKIVISVIACDSNSELIIAYTVLLSICWLSSMKTIAVDFNAENYVILILIYIRLYKIGGQL